MGKRTYLLEQDIFQTRYSRVSLIQAYSRDAAKPAAEKKTVTL